MALCWAVCIWECRTLPDTLISNCHLMWIPSRLCVCPGTSGFFECVTVVHMVGGKYRLTASYSKGQKTIQAWRWQSHQYWCSAELSAVLCWVSTKTTYLVSTKSIQSYLLPSDHPYPSLCLFQLCCQHVLGGGSQADVPCGFAEGLDMCGFLLTGSSSADRWADVFGATHNNWKIFPAR